MRISLLAFGTLFIGIMSIFIFGIIKDNVLDFNIILDLVFFILSLYFTVSGISQSIKRNTLTKRLFLGITLTIFSFFFLYLGGIFCFTPLGAALHCKF